MKTTLLTLFMFGWIINMSAQTLNQKDVPQPAMDAFTKSHPSASEVKWTKEGNNFQAVYSSENVPMASVYADSGKLIEYRTEVPLTSLPEQAQEFIRMNFTDADQKVAQQVHDYAGVVTYRINVRGQSLDFDSTGNSIKSPVR